jgi:hypothetical protein
LKTDLTSLQLPPNCFGLPYGNHDLHPVNSRYPGAHPFDNYGCSGYSAPPTCPGSGGSAPAVRPTARTAQRDTASGPLTSTGGVGSAAEQKFVAGLLAPLSGHDPSTVPTGLLDLLAGPMLRGMAVSVA